MKSSARDNLENQILGIVRELCGYAYTSKEIEKEPYEIKRIKYLLARLREGQK